MFEQLESLRNKLHEVMEEGNTEDILKVSQELDVLIMIFTQKNLESRPSE
ncbi:MAG: Spo0E family sporulation regulatory protein-aspartic acid phosphatase [Bacillota bacterium]|nr:Spo0E family sporulation regulatory protein-aspartic acid phosphatase [Bacillota bacterium]